MTLENNLPLFLFCCVVATNWHLTKSFHINKYLDSAQRIGGKGFDNLRCRGKHTPEMFVPCKTVELVVNNLTCAMQLNQSNCWRGSHCLFLIKKGFMKHCVVIFAVVCRATIIFWFVVQREYQNSWNTISFFSQVLYFSSGDRFRNWEQI